MFKNNRMVNLVHSLSSRGAFHIVAGSFLTKFVSFFGSIFVVRILSKEDYGVLSYYENLWSYFIILAGGGMAAGITRYLVLAKNNMKSDCFWYAVKRGSFWNLFLVFVCVLFMLLYPHPEKFEKFNDIGIILAFCLPFVFLMNIGQYSLRALFDNKSYAWSALISTVILIASRVAGAWCGGLYLTVKSRFGAEILAALLCMALAIRRVKESDKARERLDKSFKSDFNRYSAQLMLTDGLWAVFMLNDMFILGRFIGSETVIADYKIACVIPANLAILTSAVGIFVSPYFTKYENEREYEWVKQKARLVLKTTAVVIGSASLLCFVLAKPMIELLYGPPYISAVPTMRVLLVASFFNNGIRATVANILSSIGKQKVNLLVASIGIVIQICLDILLLLKWGSLGVAVSSAIVYLFMGVTLSIYFIKYLNLKETIQ